MLNQIKIGKSAVETTTLGLGTNKVGGHNLFEGLEDQDGYEVVRTALDSNIKLLDTAYAYGYGRSEEIIGDVIKDYDRSNITIATKAAQDVNHDYKPNNNPEFLTQQIDHALKRLKTDYIDIFYIHFPDETTNKAEAIEALVKARDAGKIKAIGVSNFSLEQIKEANADDVIDVVEDHYSLVHRDAEKELIPYLNEHNITFVPYFPLASGILTGKYAQTDSGKFNQYSQAEFDQIIDAVEKVRGIAESKDATVAQVVLAWYLKNPNLGVVIPGARKAEQIKSNVKATAIELSDQEYHQIDAWFKF
ncbi:aldo/keto reductase [Pediococcus pentosaceus]|uniref:Aldo/keto reductase n=1 Tax=Pediococcus pentosaceus TaxID=1255 RepID=A0AB73HC05_PEDPE|nr:aldo/keto reductase [Pediococcus pentosaceus]MBF7114008.1 aldo/keto reductase [Pediococcus pentosaceus]MCM6809631.1 aldo/keto reductase [Pediococcus pentosaceus]MCM6812013.1 aldo/keto reductase [Pediococcus pentosaceus]MCM6818504.1 aldo/keto reductase [Pediococcus pentosaceus]MDN3206309.1 aldo/keto reductase [Pediococcus pentosaceus]